MAYTDLTYFTCPLPEPILRLTMAGKYKEAKMQIEDLMKKNGLPEILKKRLKLELRILEEYKATYTLSGEDLFKKLCEELKDFSKEEFDALKKDGSLDYLYIDGNECFIENALENALKTVPALSKRRRDETSILADEKKRQDLNAMMERMKGQGSVHAKYKVRECLKLHPESIEEGASLKAYLPIPVRDKQCYPGEIKAYVCNNKKDVDIHIAGEDQGQRTVCFSGSYESSAQYFVEFDYEIKARYVKPDPKLVEAYKQPLFAFDTEEILPQIAFTPYMKALAMELKGEETNPLLIARSFYDFVTTVATYRFVPAYVTKTNIPEYFSTGLHGDCGMHALTFITLCRIVGIPAKWQAGWYTKPESVGNHDWACFYVEPYGWLFVDGSFGGSAYRIGDYDRWDFYFGNLDPYRMVANSDLQVEFDPPFPDLRLDPYDNQTGEVAIDDHTIKASEFTLERELLEVSLT